MSGINVQMAKKLLSPEAIEKAYQSEIGESLDLFLQDYDTESGTVGYIDQTEASNLLRHRKDLNRDTMDTTASSSNIGSYDKSPDYNGRNIASDLVEQAKWVKGYVNRCFCQLAAEVMTED